MKDYSLSVCSFSHSNVVDRFN